MPFYNFTQNNSGGRFWIEKDRSAHTMIIEASSEQEAVDRAFGHTGMYINDGQDCPCCGDRWSTYSNGPYDEPRPSYGQYTVGEWVMNRKARGFLGNETCLVLMADGTIHWYEQQFTREIDDNA